MKIFITTGTYEFLMKIKQKYANEKIILMQNAEHTLLLHETEGKTVFASPRKYESAAAAGELADGNFFIFTHLPVSDEGKPVFEYHVQQNMPVIEHKPGFAAFRLLRPVKEDTYIAMTAWKDEDSYKRWKRSLDYQLVHSLDITGIATNKIAYNAPAYTKDYFVPQEEEEEK
ncbi:antibiotic biosynthesis monooxygenase family protein [Heyndrickxia acidiproducens]|uniref:antibiotic biosynthesis monooxygenase family protein n=1 Tax=Heyndrickxia acidiproducens TaxID=1121084 RepID=UPI000374BC4B|nr:antibiotic biosynthesis monooxygenase [Heyndrickxia acidiproducens]